MPRRLHVDHLNLVRSCSSAFANSVDWAEQLRAFGVFSPRSANSVDWAESLRAFGVFPPRFTNSVDWAESLRAFRDFFYCVTSVSRRTIAHSDFVAFSLALTVGAIAAVI
jgi:hypothetical protein